MPETSLGIDIPPLVRGRPRGRVGIRTLARLAYCDEFLTDGKPLPLPVMITNMRKAFAAAERADKAVTKALLKDMTDENGKVPLKEAYEVIKAAAQLAIDLRDRSQAYAVAAAPYIHPQLSRIQVNAAPGQSLVDAARNGEDATIVEAVANAQPSPLMLELNAWDDAAKAFEERTSGHARPAERHSTSAVPAPISGSPVSEAVGGTVVTPKAK